MKRSILIAVLIVLAASPLSGQTKGDQPASVNVRTAIEAANKKFIEAFNKGDVATVAGLYATDAKVLPPNSQMVEGRQNIQAFWQSLVKMGAKLSQLETTHVESHGDLAYEVGTYTLNIQPASGQAVTDTGKYVVVWKRQGGEWKLVADIWNTNMPAAEQ